MMLAGPGNVQPELPSSNDPFSTTSVGDCLRSALGVASAMAEPRRASADESFMLTRVVAFVKPVR